MPVTGSSRGAANCAVVLGLPPLRNAVDYVTTRMSRRYIVAVRKELGSRKPAAPAPRKAPPSKPRKATTAR